MKYHEQEQMLYIFGVLDFQLYLAILPNLTDLHMTNNLLFHSPLFFHTIQILLAAVLRREATDYV